MGHCFSDSASLPKLIPPNRPSLEAPAKQNMREPRSSGFAHRGASTDMQEFTNHRERNALQVLALGEPPAIKQKSSNKVERKTSKRKKRALGFLSRKGRKKPGDPMATSLSPRKTKDGRKYFHIAVDGPEMNRMFGLKNSSTYRVNQRRQSVDAQFPKKDKSVDRNSTGNLDQDQLALDTLEQVRNAEGYDLGIAQQYPHLIIEDGKKISSSIPAQQQQQSPEPKRHSTSKQKGKFKSKSKTRNASQATHHSPPVPRLDMGPTARDFAPNSSFSLRAGIPGPSRARHGNLDPFRAQESQAQDEAPACSSIPSQDKPGSITHDSQRSIPKPQISSPWPQLNTTAIPTTPPLQTNQPSRHWSVPLTPSHSAQNSIEAGKSPLSSLSPRSNAPSSILSSNAASDAESGIIMNAQSAEFVRAQGYYAGGIHKKPPKPGPAPTRALPSLPEAAAIAGASPEARVTAELTLEHSPIKVQSSPRYRYSPVKAHSPVAAKSPPSAVLDTKTAPQPPPERKLADSPTIMHSNIPTKLSKDAPLSSKNDNMTSATAVLEQQQIQRVRSTNAIKERDLERARTRKDHIETNAPGDSNKADEEHQKGNAYLPSLCYSPKILPSPVFKAKIPAPTPPIPSRAPIAFSPIILLAEQTPTPAPSCLPTASQHSSTDKTTPAPFPSTICPQPDEKSATAATTATAAEEPSLPSDAISDLETRLLSRILAIERKNLLLQHAFLAVLEESATLSARSSSSSSFNPFPPLLALGGGIGGAGSGSGGAGSARASFAPSSSMGVNGESSAESNAPGFRGSGASTVGSLSDASRLEAKFDAVLEALGRKV